MMPTYPTTPPSTPLQEAIVTYNAEGPEALTHEEVVLIGAAISAKLGAIGLPGLESIAAIASDQAHTELQQVVPASRFTLKFKDGTSTTIAIHGDPGFGKSGVPIELRAAQAAKVGLLVDAADVSSMERLMQLAVRFAALKEIAER